MQHALRRGRTYLGVEAFIPLEMPKLRASGRRDVDAWHHEYHVMRFSPLTDRPQCCRRIFDRPSPGNLRQRIHIPTAATRRIYEDYYS